MPLNVAYCSLDFCCCLRYRTDNYFWTIWCAAFTSFRTFIAHSSDSSNCFAVRKILSVDAVTWMNTLDFIVSTELRKNFQKRKRFCLQPLPNPSHTTPSCHSVQRFQREKTSFAIRVERPVKASESFRFQKQRCYANFNMSEKYTPYETNSRLLQYFQHTTFAHVFFVYMRSSLA
jgi:hypothetical protein